MNLILCSQDEYEAGTVVLQGERAEHVRCVHRAAQGDLLRAGLVNGGLGQLRVRSIKRHRVELEVVGPFEEAPPPAHPLTLAVAMCRPPSLHKVLGHATSMGVKRFLVFHTRRSEKSFWDSHAMEPKAIEQCLRLGLEQAKDTVMPSIEWHRRFKPFAQDVLGPSVAAAPLWLADPKVPCQDFVNQGAKGEPGTLMVGPEGGFVPFERELLLELGAKGVNLGPRILRVEVATVSLLASYGAGRLGQEPPSCAGQETQ